MRTAIKFIENQINRLNLITNKQKQTKALQVGYFDLSQAYGGFKLIRYTNKAGACSDALNTGYTTKKDLSNQIKAFELGLTWKIVIDNLEKH